MLSEFQAYEYNQYYVSTIGTVMQYHARMKYKIIVCHIYQNSSDVLTGYKKTYG